MSKKKKQGFETRSIHAGQEADPLTGAVMMPIYTSSTFKQDSPGIHKGYDYSRSGNPTRNAFEECMTSLEDGIKGYGFSFLVGFVGRQIQHQYLITLLL